ncbi:MAG: FAD-dependent oxidoreductase [Opitutus sp.]|nr:FAD-dependent oxidoreductase [Opitutus sp.]
MAILHFAIPCGSSLNIAAALALIRPAATVRRPYCPLKNPTQLFFASTFLVASTLAAQPAPPTAPPAPPADVIVVGAGIAGLSAAWELARGGAKVTVVDMASVFGGHSVMAEGILCIVDTPDQAAQGLRDSSDIAYKDFVTWGEDSNPEWVRYYVNHSRREIYDWVTAMGVTFDSVMTIVGNTVPRQHHTKGRGLALISPVYRECLRSPNITFGWNTRVDRLLTSGRRIAGVATTNVRTGVTTEFRADAVVLATGGYQSNLTLVREFWPADLPFPKNILIGSGINSVGSGLKIAQDAGAGVARLDHQWNYITGLPDPRFPGAHRGLNAYNTDSIWVNADGRRFIAEHTSHKFGMPILLQQPGGTYWSIFDESIKRSFFVSGSNWANFSVIEKLIFGDPTLVKSADSLHELAAKSGLPTDALADTVRRYNALVEKGVDTEFALFGPGKLIQPKKITKPPFYAVQFHPVTRKSMGGVVIDTSCRVQDAKQRTIPGLYAAGELTGLAGINGMAGLEGTFLGPSIVTGRVAGRTVLVDSGRKIGTGPVATRPDERLVKPDPLATTTLCMTCHDLPKLTAQPRPGYWHFEKVHERVVATQSECTTCHAELTPTYFPEIHRTDRLAQVRACSNCHTSETR